MQNFFIQLFKGQNICLESCDCRNEGCREKWNMMRENDDDNEGNNYDSDDENDE